MWLPLKHIDEFILVALTILALHGCEIQYHIPQLDFLFPHSHLVTSSQDPSTHAQHDILIYLPVLP